MTDSLVPRPIAVLSLSKKSGRCCGRDGRRVILKFGACEPNKVCARWGGEMLPPTSPPRRSYCAWLLAAFLHAGSPAQVSAQQARPPHSARIAVAPRACGCADGRHFAIGASMFGKNSTRVVITGFRAGLRESILGSTPAPCLDLLVLGQVVQLARAQDGRPFLKRQSLKRGIIHGICETKIHFVQAKKLYDFFSDGGSAVTLTEQDVDAPSIP